MNRLLAKGALVAGLCVLLTCSSALAQPGVDAAGPGAGMRLPWFIHGPIDGGAYLSSGYSAGYYIPWDGYGAGQIGIEPAIGEGYLGPPFAMGRYRTGRYRPYRSVIAGPGPGAPAHR